MLYMPLLLLRSSLSTPPLTVKVDVDGDVWVRCCRSVRFRFRITASPIDWRWYGDGKTGWGWGFEVLDGVIIGLVGLSRMGTPKTARRKVTSDSSQGD
jgi:hypothetical protein